MDKINKYHDIDPYGEEIWEDEKLYGLEYLESIRGIYPEVDRITDRIKNGILMQRERLMQWEIMPWWKKIFISKIEFIYR
jgi:hypothetical protein